ncbi:MAG: hypothetical protein FWD42_10805 [Solirubrobacterales bacterium]|nr:hypothetical protein [Solirubrobacterales bacterium]
MFLSESHHGEEVNPPQVFAGARGVFHLVWTHAGKLEATTARLSCA